MHNTDLFSIVVAINHLSDAVQQIQDAAKEANNGSWLKDYIMPIGTLFLSAAIAYSSAKSGYKWQDKFLTNKLKIDTINKTFMGFQNVQGTLLSLKENYASEELPSNPLQRIAAMPQMIYSFTPLTINYEHLLQVIMTDDENLHGNPWVHISSYISIQDQFNQLDRIIQERNSFDSQVKESLARNFNRKYFSYSEILQNVDAIAVHKYIELTESIINMIDNLTISVDDFLRTFPQTANKIMGGNKSEHYKMIQGYKNDSENVKKLQVRTTPLDLEYTEQLLNIPQDDIKKKLCDHSFTIQTKKTAPKVSS